MWPKDPSKTRATDCLLQSLGIHIKKQSFFCVSVCVLTGCDVTGRVRKFLVHFAPCRHLAGHGFYKVYNYSLTGHAITEGSSHCDKWTPQTCCSLQKTCKPRVPAPLESSGPKLCLLFCLWSVTAWLSTGNSWWILLTSRHDTTSHTAQHVNGKTEIRRNFPWRKDRMELVCWGDARWSTIEIPSGYLDFFIFPLTKFTQRFNTDSQ